MDPIFVGNSECDRCGRIHSPGYDLCPKQVSSEDNNAFLVRLNNYVFHRLETRVEKPTNPKYTRKVQVQGRFAAFIRDGGFSEQETTEIIEYYGDAIITALSWELGEKIPLVRVGYVFETDPVTFNPVVSLFYELQDTRWPD